MCRNPATEIDISKIAIETFQFEDLAEGTSIREYYPQRTRGTHDPSP